MPTLKEYADMPGVRDLPFKTRAQFALAVKAEDEGNHEKAEAYLNKAIQTESEEK